MNKNDTVTISAGAVTVAEKSRTISGVILPWDKFGATNNGPLKFSAGSITIPDAVEKVKLLSGHSPTGVAVGHATAIESRPEGLYATFQLGSHAAADDALLLASEKTVDAFSIEAFGIERQGTTVTRSALTAVALVPNPAFDGARVDNVTAEQSKEESPETKKEEDTMPKLAPGTLPGDAQKAPGESNHFSLDGVIDYLTGQIAGTDSGATHAELKDITDAGMIDRAAPQWLGQLWSGVTYKREIVPLMTQKPLTSRKAVGYRWTTKPGVAKYSGNKTEIPSKTASIESVERESERWAGGNDLDRAFWDFKEREFLAAYWEAMAESYALETDLDALKFLIENALAIDGKATNVQTAISRGSISIGTKLRSPATFAIINPGDLEQVLNLSKMDAPQYLGIAGTITDPSKWTLSEGVTPGTAIIGAKTAVTHFELAGSPLRVEAEHIAKGGRDAALFGYTAKMVNRPEGLVKVTFDTNVTVEEE